MAKWTEYRDIADAPRTDISWRGAVAATALSGLIIGVLLGTAWIVSGFLR